MNIVSIAGYVGSSSLAEFATGEMLKIRVATTSRRKMGEEWKEETEWHSVTIWGQRAKGLAGIVKPGRFVAVTGTLRTRAVESEDGSTKYYTEVVATDVTLGPAGKGPSEEAPERPAALSAEPSAWRKGPPKGSPRK